MHAGPARCPRSRFDRLSLCSGLDPRDAQLVMDTVDHYPIVACGWLLRRHGVPEAKRGELLAEAMQRHLGLRDPPLQ